MMNPEVKARWVCALRSDKYEQGHGRLVGEDGRGRGHCCLGVLADEEGIPREEWQYASLLSEVVMSNDPPQIVTALDHFGIPGVVEDVLANMNDGGGGLDRHTFKQIADFIEQHPEL